MHLGSGGLTFRGHDHRAFRHEEGHNIYRLAHQTAPVAPQVEDQLLHSLALELQKGVAQLSGDVLRESALVDVPGRVVEHPGIFNVRKMDSLSCDNNVHNFLRTHFQHLELDCRTRLALHPVRAFLTGQTVGALPVNLHNLVPAVKPVLLGRRAFVRLVDDDVPVLLGLVDDRPDASVGLVDHHHKILVLLFRNVNRVRVKAFQHRIDASPFDPVHRQRIHIRAVKLLEYGILDLGPFPELETL